MPRLLLAVVLAPLAAAPMLAVLYGPWAWTEAGLNGLMPVLVAVLFVSYPATLLIGVPVHLMLARQRCTRLAQYLSAGALLGGLPIVAYCVVAIVVEAKFAPSGVWRATQRNAEWGAIGAVVFAAASAAVAAAFWWIAVRDRR